MAKGGADIRWRVEMPAKHLGLKLVVMHERHAKRVLTKPNKGKIFPWQLTEDGATYPQHEGVAVWTRPCMARATHACAMAAQGVRQVAEVDDNYLSDPLQNIFMRINGYNRWGQRSHAQAFATMDTIIFSTRWLRDEYHEIFKKNFHYAPEMVVARNHVDLEEWREPVRDWDKVRVGIMGSHQHVWDWRLAAPALHLAKEMGCELVFIGLDPGEADPEWKKFLGDYVHIPWVDPEVYHARGLPLDIGLCPLVTNKHTLGKSDVKFLEYSMSGAATVAQNNAVYNRSVIHGETGLLAGSPDEMALLTKQLIRSVGLRRRLVEAARQYVREERTIQKNLHEWSEAIFD